MQNNEKLHSPEIEPKKTMEQTEASNNTLTAEDIETLFLARASALESIKSHVCLSFFYTITEKLATEKQTLMDILNFNDRKHQMLERYTFILPSQYFEQKFISK